MSAGFAQRYTPLGQTAVDLGLAPALAAGDLAVAEAEAEQEQRGALVRLEALDGGAAFGLSLGALGEQGRVEMAVGCEGE